ncbi:MAG: peptide chain release factor N(5)-glutamine methyltransferase [Candidatus Bipolaricaulota bacterium]|nr:peptide chain release factor N(5)-glutamine methyltransferase [Candidatus Bipolaricaulota bacterium]
MSVDWTVREILNWTRGYLQGGGIGQPRLEAEILLAHSLNVDRLHLYLSPDKSLTEEERERFRAAIQKRRAGVPLQHLIGEVGFFGLRFRVGAGALVPRPETEELVERALALAPRERKIRCLDLGTGAGVIAVSLAKFLPNASVTAVDLSSEALELARENARSNGVSDRITFRESDWLRAVEGRYDLVVSNPPYVPEEEIGRLAVEVRDHEPRLAINGGKGGMERIEALTRDLGAHLHSGAAVLLEIGEGQGDAVAALLRQAGLTEVRVETDLSGRQRFVIGRCL